MKNKLLRVSVVAFLLLLGGVVKAQEWSDYVFSTGEDSTIWKDISVGATTIFGTGVNDTVSGLIDIGFDFLFKDRYYNKFAVSDNGTMSLGLIPIGLGANAGYFTYFGDKCPKISPFARDNAVGLYGYVKYKLLGQAPSRILVVEYSFIIPLNIKIQVQLYEGSNNVVMTYNNPNPGVSTYFQIGMGDSSGYFLINSSTNTSSYHTGYSSTYSNVVPGTHRYYKYTWSLPSCARPIQVLSSSTDTTIALSWTNVLGSLPQSYILDYAVSGTDNLTTVQLTTPYYTISNLMPSQSYDISVRTICSGGDTSAYTYARVCTDCASFLPIPYYDNFEGYEGANFPHCSWSRFALSSSNNYGPVLNVGNYYGRSNTHLQIYVGGNYILTTYPIDLNTYSLRQLVMSMYCYSNSSTVKMVVGVMKRLNGFSSPDVSTFTAIDTLDLSVEWDEKDVNFTNNDSVEDDDCYIGFVCYDSQTNSTLSTKIVYIDNVNIGLEPSCARPAGFEVYENSATVLGVRWNTVSDNVGYEVAYGIDRVNLDYPEYVANVSDTSVLLENLLPDSTYSIYVRTLCADGSTSAWRGPLWATAGKIKIPTSGVLDMYTCDAELSISNSSNDNSIITLYASSPDMLFKVEGELVFQNTPTQCLYVFDGADTNSPIICAYNTSISDISFISTTGAITVMLPNSNSQNRLSSMKFDVHCVPPVQSVLIDDIRVDEGATSAFVKWFRTGNTDDGVMYNYRLMNENILIDSGTTDERYKLFSQLASNTSYTVMLRIVYSDGSFSDWNTKEFCTLYGMYITGGDNVNNSQRLPVPGNKYGYTQQLILSSELNGAETISAISLFSYSVTTSVVKDSIDVYMAHTTLDSYNNFDTNSKQHVYSGPLILNEGRCDIILDTVFHYNGIDNMIIVVDDNSGYLNLGDVFREHSVSFNSVTAASNSYDINEWNITNYPVALYQSRNDMFLTMDIQQRCIAPCVNIVEKDANSVSILLARGNNETNWIISYKEEFDIQWNVLDTLPALDTLYTISDLIPSTVYNIKVDAICGGTTVEEIVSVSTKCLPITTLPYFEDFDTWDSIPMCWSVLCDNNIGSYVELRNDYFSQSLPFVVHLKSTNNSYSALLLPKFETDIDSLVLTFAARKADRSILNEIEVGIVSNPNFIETFRQVDVVRVETVSEWEYYTVSFEGYTGNDGYIALLSKNRPNSLYLDNIEVVKIQNCGRVSNIVVDNIGTNTARVSWSDSVSMEFIIEYGEIGFEKGTGVQISTENTSIMLHALEPNKLYDVYVRSICFSGDTSLFFFPLSFRTQCSSMLDLPYIENFDTYSSYNQMIVPDCWHHGCLTGTGDTYPYIDYTYDANGNGASLRLGTKRRYYQTDTYYSYFALLPIDSMSYSAREYMLDFKLLRTTVAADYDDKLLIGVMVNPDSISTFVVVDTVYCTADSGEWQTVSEIELTRYLGRGKYIAFLTRTSGLNSEFCIDDIVVDITPSCYKPVDLYVQNVSNNSLTVSWTERNSATTWIVEYGDVGFQIGTGNILTTNSNRCTISGLSASSAYDIYVRAVCDVGDTSAYSNVFTASTAQNPANVPYNYTFEAAEEWENWYSVSNKAATWRRGMAAAYNGMYSMYISTDNGLTNNTQNTIVNASTYRDFDFGLNDTSVFISFKANVGGNVLSNTDGLAVFVTEPIIFPFVSSVAQTSPWGHIDSLSTVGSVIRLTGTYNDYYYEINNVSGLKRLVFFYYNQSGGDYVGAPASVDDIAIDYLSCPYPYNIILNNVYSTTVSMSWNGSATGYYVYYRPVQQSYFDSVYTPSNSITLTGLQPDMEYVYALRAVCGNQLSRMSELAQFITPQELAQVPYYCGFEPNESETYMWNLYNGNSVNRWCVDTAVRRIGQYSLYISDNNGVSNAYDAQQPSVVWAYRDFYFPAVPEGTDFDLSFIWKCDGGTQSNKLRVFIAPPDTLFAGATSVLVQPRNAVLLSELNNDPYFNTENIVLRGADYGGTIQRIYFCWQNSYYTNVNMYPPVIDDILISSLVAGCVMPQVVVDSLYTSAVLSWNTPGRYMISYKLQSEEEWSDEVEIVGNSYTIIGLEPATVYDYKVYKVCDSINVSAWNIKSFTTLPLPCLSPDTLIVNDVDYTSAQLSWTSEWNNEELWQICYGYNWELNLWDTVEVNTPTVLLEGLYSGTSYNVHIRSYCSVDSNFYSDMGEYVFVTKACEGVSEVIVGDVTEHSAVITWVANEGQTDWEIVVGLKGVDEASATKVSVHGNPIYVVNDLMADTLYDVYVRNVCDLGVYSAWTDKVQFRSVTGAIENVDKMDKEIMVYPNPAHNSTTVVVENVVGEVEFVVVDVNGKRIIMEEYICDGIFEKTIDLEKFTAGIYFVKVTNELFTASQKLIVK